MSIVCLTPLHAACIFGLAAVQGEHENPQEIWRKENNRRTCSIPIQPLRMKLGKLSEAIYLCPKKRYSAETFQLDTLCCFDATPKTLHLRA